MLRRANVVEHGRILRRYTRDGVVKTGCAEAAEELRLSAAWRERNKRPELKGKGYGMLEARSADPEDPNRAFMLNRVRLYRTKPCGGNVAAVESRGIETREREAQAMKAGIRSALLEQSPSAVPLDDGSWCPTCPPWSGGPWRALLYAKPDRTHGALRARFAARSALPVDFESHRAAQAGWIGCC